MMQTRRSAAQKLTDVSLAQDEAAPAWAAQAVANLDACDIITFPAEETVLTRSQAAQMLVAAMELQDSRSGGWSLLDWAK